MKLLLELSQQDLTLSAAEALAQTRTKTYYLIDNLLIISTTRDLHHLAYTKRVFTYLFTCTLPRLIKRMQTYSWKKVYKNNFYVELKGTTTHTSKQLANIIYDQLDYPSVKMKNATTHITFFFHEGKVICGKLLYEITESYEQRKPHHRPELHPSSLHPRLARAMVNLTGIKQGTLVDPFCGSGGILIEAALRGLAIHGYDIDEHMLARARNNLAHYNITKYALARRDATTIHNKINYVATDLPYAKNTKQQNLDELYKKFFAVLDKHLRHAAVVGLPSTINPAPLLKQTTLHITHMFTYYLHKSLSKKIIVLTKTSLLTQ